MTTVETKGAQSSFQQRIVGDGPLLPVIVRLALPVVAMMYLQNAYNIIDTIWVGQLLGEVPLAGIAAGGYILWCIFGLVNFVSVGIAAIVARRIGEGNVEMAQYTATRGLRYSLVVSIFISIAIYFLMPQLFRMMGTSPSVTAEGSTYMYVLLLGVPFIFMSIAIQSIFQASGDTVTPMWLMALSLPLNIALDPILMLGLFGAPAMGIAGAALATVISRMVWVLIGIWLLTYGKRIGQQQTYHPVFGRIKRVLPAIHDGLIRLRPNRSGKWHWPEFQNILRIGLPNVFSMTLFPVVYMIMVRIPAEYGAHQIAALRIGHTAEGMSFFLALGLNIATATCVGQNLGAGKPVRAAKAAWTSSSIAASILFIFSICFYVFPEQIGAIFSPEKTTIMASAVYLRILAWSQIFMGVEIVLGGAFSGAGDTVPPMLVSVPLNLVRIPLAYLLADTLGWGVIGVWWAISGTSIIKGIIVSGWFLKGNWAKKNV